MTKGKNITAIISAVTAVAMSVFGYFEYQRQIQQSAANAQPLANYHMSVCIDGYAYYVMAANNTTSMIIRLDENGQSIVCQSPENAIGGTRLGR